MPKVLLTGSGKRLGNGLAFEFAAKNWDVAIHYNSSEKTAFETVGKIKTMKLNSIAVKADIRNKTEIH